MKKFLKFLLALAILVSVERFCRKETDGFRLEKTQSDLSYNPSWEIPLTQTQEKEVLDILDQPFFFLGSGVQSYAFVSKDKKTVLKLFKHYHMWPGNEVLAKVPLPSFLEGKRQNIIEERVQRMHSILNSCKISYDECREESGVFYLHLNKTSHWNKKLKVYDKIGIAHELELEEYAFILQKKAEPFTPYMEKLIKQGSSQEAKEGLFQLLNLIKNRCHKGIANTDKNVRRNVGFLDKTPILIDVGSFVHDDKLQSLEGFKKEMLFETKELQTWLEKKHPELLPDFQEHLNNIISHETIS